MRNKLPASPVNVSAAALSSMIDIIFQLIIFFVVTASFDAAQLDSSVVLPEVASGVAVQALPPERIILNVQADGTVTSGYREIPAAEVPTALTLLLRQAADSGGGVIVINGDGNARHGAIAPVLAAAAAAGFADVRINALIEKQEPR